MTEEAIFKFLAQQFGPWAMLVFVLYQFLKRYPEFETSHLFKEVILPRLKKRIIFNVVTDDAGLTIIKNSYTNIINVIKSDVSGYIIQNGLHDINRQAQIEMELRAKILLMFSESKTYLSGFKFLDNVPLSFHVSKYTVEQISSYISDIITYMIAQTDARKHLNAINYIDTVQNLMMGSLMTAMQTKIDFLKDEKKP